jgi:hypothetical protein
MPRNGRCDSSRSLESNPLGALESGQSVCLGARWVPIVIPQSSKLSTCLLPSTPQLEPSGHSNHEVPGSDRSVDMDDMPPPLGVKLTGYRLVFMVTVLLFGTVKTILTYMGQSIAPTTLDWVAGTFLTAV